MNNAPLTRPRAASMLVATLGLALIAAACSNGSPPASAPSQGGSGQAATAVAYSQCMRTHGVPSYPDASSGHELRDGLPKVDPQELGVSTSQFQTAQSACAHLLPNNGQLTQSEAQQDLQAMLAIARCMRSHGVPTWPDPTNGPAGWGFDLVHVHGFDPNSSQIDQKLGGCGRRLRGGFGIPLARPGRPG
jgi:hypothetical protein